MMKAIVLREFGGIEKLVLGDVPKPEPGEGEVLLRIKAAGVNPVDFKIRKGLLFERGYPHQFPIIPGWDMAGIVEARGYGAKRFQAGDHVYGYCRRPVIARGTYSEFISIPESYITHKPRNVSFEIAAAIPLAALTAYQSVYVAAGLEKRQSLLVIGASGGVGSFAVQFGRIAGAKVMAVASEKNHAYVKSLGAKYAVDYAAGDFRQGVRKIFPNGADVVLDCAGGDSLLKAYDCVKKGGHLVTIVEKENETLAQGRQIYAHYVFVEPDVTQLDQIRKWVEARKL
ncbi:MAG: NADP-dependent oxidoreductase, partial [Candidatus Omnitrophica bacterium]|nr:NADP-dependent oxidoreductase [Candidatus Omnitrophota bacterium]